ncbi:antibiotic biosynthesis monooxygenase family protein [Sporosarcina sp. NPDC096371]|uniref:antibiotic biosynthesis monooxygenase family protein n=1 Tax=Sporosarcina sp. NPDC096371 TaxID=3364530 RepID=UPI00382C778B
MNIFITSGTPGFMEQLREKHAKEMMVVMHAGNDSLLVHETNGETVFQTPRRYEVIASSGTLKEEGYFVLNHIPVTDEGRPIFEHSFKEQLPTITEALGFTAFRLLRPLQSDAYIVMTEWSTSTYFDMWKNSSSFHDAHLTNPSDAGVDRTLHLFTEAAFETTYIAQTKETDA